MSERLEIGRVAKAHGLRGEVVVMPITNQPDRFGVGAHLWLDGEEMVVAASRPNQQAFLVRFEGVNDRTDAEQLRGRMITAPPLGAAPEGEVWVHEAIGSEVRELDGSVVGVVTSVRANPAHDLLELEGGVLIPMVFVVDQQPGVLVVQLPDGLLDL